MSDDNAVTPTRVKLEWFEELLAGLCGMLRRTESERQKFGRTYSSVEDHPMATSIDAAGAEVAVAKMLNRYWRAGVNTLKWPDVSIATEVRHTPRPRGAG